MKDITNILLAEDDHNLGLLLKESLELKGYDVELYRNGEEAWENFNTNNIDLCVLDVMMPKKDGFTLAKEIRRVDKKMPIIFLTAKSMKEDKITGFNLGADDYITKPFNFEELYLRIEAIMRRVNGDGPDLESQSEFTVGQYAYNANERTLLRSGESQRLTTKENQLLRLLCLHQNKVLERDVALKSIWGDDNYFTGRSMDVYITKLRKYLKDDESVEIQNIHGTGFRLLVKANTK